MTAETSFAHSTARSSGERRGECFVLALIVALGFGIVVSNSIILFIVRFELCC
jgi:NADH:ubiquinone oxidoreductase subunit 2 (subunit N)